MSSGLYERLNDRATVYDPFSGEIEIPVNMPVSYCGTKRPRGALLRLSIEDGLVIVENRWEPSGVSGIPPFVIPESNL